MATIQSMGAGSGMDMDRLVRDLVAAERQPVEDRLNRSEARFSSQLTAMAEFKGALSALGDTARSLERGGGLSERSATSSDPEVFTASAQSGTAPGQFDIEVLELASAHKVATDPFASRTDPVGTGTLAFSVGDSSFSINVQEGNNSLADIRDAINSAPDNRAVTANIINEDGGSRLVLTARDTGAENVIEVSASGGDGGLAALTSFDELTAAADARVRIETFEFSSASNQVEGAIDGVTLDLQRAAPGEIQTLTVSENRESTIESVQRLVERFNALADINRNLAGYDPVAEQGGPLQGDATVRGAMSQVQRILNGLVEGADPRFNSLPALGITSNAEGRFELDEQALNRALDERPGVLDEVFGGDRGIATNLSSYLGSVLGPGSLMEGRVAGLQSRLDSIAEQRVRLDTRMQSVEARYQRQFGALDSMIAQMNQTSEFLAQQFAALEGQGRR
ncbi:flagellar filament capping protein FliD [Wenzhouxiangella sp. AB-CW3]|uniref:flagellar filament capping protein FliD n=1 Tax=Wenzhouxiangella sp. AB-CW3 TaxID=2771012 RepID=UPI00168A86C9|nr:flagellar filament capping protein FliD [Wenzhouxiangella sp. AB-CW3]QOC21214.1 flagellar filament capping protein FliD [Wenzhouxiangella sp. AB-CW3]